MSERLNLTREECAQRSSQVKVDTYNVALDLGDLNEPKAATYGSVTTVTFTSSGQDTWLDLVADTLTALSVNGQDAELPAYDGARVPLKGLKNGENTVVVSAQCRYSRTGEGLHRFTDPVDGKTYAYTHFEPTDARRVYACFEQPDLKGRITFQMTVPEGVKTFSNQSVASEEFKDSLRKVTFAPTLPLSTYLSSIAVGPFHVVTDTWREGEQEIPLSAICRASMAEFLEADEILRITKQGLSFFDKNFKYPYPWGKYESIFLPEYNIGAMEHPGLVTFNENVYIFRGTPSTTQREMRAEVIMHEMTHMWFGDLVTPKWWDDTWLKESFADLMGYLAATEAAGFEGCWVSFALQRKQWAYMQDLGPSTHPIVADVPDLEAARQNFDGITYAKGAAVLKQLMAYAGREAFFKASQSYFKRHEYGTATLDDLIECLKESSEADLSAWVPSWLQTTGPSIIGTSYENGELFVTCESEEVGTKKEVKRNHRVQVSTFAQGPNGIERTSKVSVLIDSPRVKVALPEGTKVDLAVANDDDLTYALVRFGNASVDALTESISSIEPAITRAVAWSGLYNMVRDAQLPASRYIAAAEANARTETDAGLLALVLEQARSCIVEYLPGKARPAAADTLIELVHAGLEAAEQGTDLQRAWSSALAASGGMSHRGVKPLRAVLSGSIKGLELTPTLRWRLLAQLAALGAADESELEAEYKRDSTMTGATALARARAAMPGKSNKQRVWNELTVDREGITNDKQGALIVGFGAGEVGPKEPSEFTEPYFANIASWWSELTMVMASKLVRGLFPSTAIEQGGVEGNVLLKAARSWLEKNGSAPAALRKIVVEEVAGVERQLRAQAL